MKELVLSEVVLVNIPFDCDQGTLLADALDGVADDALLGIQIFQLLLVQEVPDVQSFDGL